jgi:hypothetical protein
MSTYNGWTNWATWNVALWVDNREEYYFARVETAEMVKKWTAESVESFVRMIFPEGTPDMADGVMMRDGLDAVNYEELTTHWNEE